MPERIQRRRTRGWRMPDGAVYVGRPTVWGNPWRPADVAPEWNLTAEQRAEWAVERYRRELEHWGLLSDYSAYVSDARWSAISDDFRDRGFSNMREATVVLAGVDLACWCPLSMPCHADVLLELANGGAA